jgi:3-oxoadipate enol-lactonase
MPDATVNGTEIYYEVHGEGSPIVFAHGVGGNHAIWAFQTAYFKQWYQVISFDHRGFGRSKHLPDGPDRSEYLADLLGLLDHLGIQKASLVAQSMGGIACLGMAAWHPERVAALVMAGTTGSMGDPQISALMSEGSEWRQRSEQLSQIDRAASKGFQQRDPALAWMFLQINSFNKANRHVVRGQDYKGPTVDEVVESKVPILWVVGSEDMVQNPAAPRRAHQVTPGSEFEEIHGSGHSTYWERPDLFNYLIRNFLDKQGIHAKGA